MTEGLQERILLGGVAGSGKTYAWLTIARAFPDRKFYVIDPDDGTRRVWFEEFPDVKNIEYYFTPTWFTAGIKKLGTVIPLDKIENHGNACFKAGIADAWKTINPKLKKGNFLILEHLGNVWSLAQGGFTDEIFDKDIGMYFLEARKEMKPDGKRLEALKGWTDWIVINKMHNDDLINKICYENPAHVIMTSSVTINSGEAKEDQDVKAFYGESKIRIEGQKLTPFKMQTILLMTNDTRGKEPKFFMSTFIKDRGRPWIEHKQWSDFTFDYLIDVAKWEI